MVKGRNIGAAPWVDMGLRRLLVEAGFDFDRDRVKIAPVPGATGQSINFGLTAAKALEDRKIDGFWANGMGAEVAVRRGAGTVVLDVRRGDGPKALFQLYHGVDSDERSRDRAVADRCACCRSGDCRDACRIERGRYACDQDRAQAVSAGRGGVDCRVDQARSSLLRNHDLTRTSLPE